jgi:RNA polymerase sigma-70 factor (ECF subfamily)
VRAREIRGEKIFVKDSNVSINRGPYTTSLSLLERVKSKSESAWERMVQLYAPLVDYWLGLAGLQRADVLDVRQEVFVAVDRKIDEFRRDRDDDTFRGWLYSIARNKLRDYWRTARKQPESMALEDLEVCLDNARLMTNTGETDVETAILCRRALDMARRDFEDTTWQGFWRVVIDGRRVAEVAAELNVSANVVYIAKARVLAKLREEFAELIE